MDTEEFKKLDIEMFATGEAVVIFEGDVILVDFVETKVVGGVEELDVVDSNDVGLISFELTASIVDIVDPWPVSAVKTNDVCVVDIELVTPVDTNDNAVDIELFTSVNSDKLNIADLELLTVVKSVEADSTRVELISSTVFDVVCSVVIELVAVLKSDKLNVAIELEAALEGDELGNVNIKLTSAFSETVENRDDVKSELVEPLDSKEVSFAVVETVSALDSNEDTVVSIELVTGDATDETVIVDSFELVGVTGVISAVTDEFDGVACVEEGCVILDIVSSRPLSALEQKPPMVKFPVVHKKIIKL